MGNKMTWETASRLTKMKPVESVWNENNPYGYKLNVNHPRIRPLYEQYIKEHGGQPLSDRERFAFETMVITRGLHKEGS